METERIALSQRERDRLKILHEVKHKHLTQVAAAVRLRVTDRQVRRMLLRLSERGDRALFTGCEVGHRTASCRPGWSRRFWRVCGSVMRILDPRWPPNIWPRRVFS